MNEQPEKACCLARQLQRIRTLFDVHNHISSHVFVSIFVSVLIISSILIVSYSMSVLDDLTEVNTQSGRNIVSTISEQIDSNADAVLQTHILLFSSDDVQAYLSQDAASMPSYAWFELYNGARQMITLFGRSQYNLISGTRLQKNEGEFLKYGSYNNLPDPTTLPKSELGRLLLHNGHAICVSEGSSGNGKTAYLISQIYDSAFDSLCEGLVMPHNGILLMDENGSVFRRYAIDEVGRAQIALYLDGLRAAMPAELEFVEHTSAKTGLTVVMVLKSLPFSEKLAAVVPYLLPMALFALVAGFLLSYGLSRKVKNGFAVMNRNIRLVENRVYDEVAVIPTEDEFGHLSRTFARMAAHIDELIAENQLRERTAHELEIQVLRAQISPHFLYNALNSVRSLAALQGMDHIERIVNAIIRLLRAALSSTETLVSLAQELEYVRNYSEICQYQYLNDFLLEEDVDPTLLECQMPPMVLQPIVENAIIHGVADLRENGLIRICARREGDAMLLTVTDNGQGMGREQIDALLRQARNTDKRRFSSIGVYNVLKRIQMRFGEAYGLAIDSVPGEYTCVRITLPYLAKERSE